MLSHSNQQPGLNAGFSPTAESSRPNLREVIKSGLLYFAVVFGVGCVLGPIRILWAIPHFGVRLGELLEMPFMLVAIIFAARWVTRRLAVPPLLWARLGMGAIALFILLVAEFGLVLQLRGLSVVEYVTSRDPVSGAVYYAMLCIFAVMPWLVAQGQISE
ncbi:MAG: hypothetical protein AAFN18_07430 [Cyanobacteria bacterium J06554_6]